MSIAAIVIIASLIIDATTEIETSPYILAGAVMIFIGTWVWRAFSSKSNDN
ncbi:hypothetical protein CDES_00735 [Corynebacterium deserti GIMN1.010]|uniref:Uncharacterized protein n=2 Tax=Corynebacterium TaxID=1716 RepID=A0A0M4CDW1_9CORY|nr:hypothetical protein CDES_00735 [Corynebacterium deserti GIMN1.010]